MNRTLSQPLDFFAMRLMVDLGPFVFLPVDQWFECLRRRANDVNTFGEVRLKAFSISEAVKQNHQGR